MLALSSSYELATTYLQVYLLWMFCSEPVLSFACVYFVITGHFLPVWGLSILRANLASTEKTAAGKVGLTSPRYLNATYPYATRTVVPLESDTLSILFELRHAGQFNSHFHNNMRDLKIKSIALYW